MLPYVSSYNTNKKIDMVFLKLLKISKKREKQGIVMYMLKMTIKYKRSFGINSKILYVFKVGEGAFKYVDFRVNVLGDGFKYHHVGQQCGKLPIQLHPILANDGKHVDKQVHALKIIEGLVVKDTEAFAELAVIVIEFAEDDLLALEVGEVVDHFCAELALALDD
jgi:hypothetical protein